MPPTGSFGRRALLSQGALVGSDASFIRISRARAAFAFKAAATGKSTMVMNGDMPMAAIKDGKLIGTDGKMIDALAQKLGLPGKPSVRLWYPTQQTEIGYISKAPWRRLGCLLCAGCQPPGSNNLQSAFHVRHHITNHRAHKTARIHRGCAC